MALHSIGTFLTSPQPRVRGGEENREEVGGHGGRRRGGGGRMGVVKIRGTGGASRAKWWVRAMMQVGWRVRARVGSRIC